MDPGVRHDLLPVVSVANGGNFPPNVNAQSLHVHRWPPGVEGMLLSYACRTLSVAQSSAWYLLRFPCRFTYRGTLPGAARRFCCYGASARWKLFRRKVCIAIASYIIVYHGADVLTKLGLNWWQSPRLFLCNDCQRTEISKTNQTEVTDVSR